MKKHLEIIRKPLDVRIRKLFKKWLVKRPQGQCQVLFSWYELDDFVEDIINVVKDIDVPHKKVEERIRNIISDLLYGHNGEYAERAIKELIKANDDAWREKIEKAMGKDEQETFNHTYETLPCGISNIRVEAFTRNCFRKHIKKSLKENK